QVTHLCCGGARLFEGFLGLRRALFSHGPQRLRGVCVGRRARGIRLCETGGLRIYDLAGGIHVALVLEGVLAVPGRDALSAGPDRSAIAGRRRANERLTW